MEKTEQKNETAGRPKGDTGSKSWLILISVFIAAATFAVYFQTLGHDYVSFDDDIYVTRNDHVKDGLSKESLAWAFTPTYPYWHPVTWLSHMLDYQLYGFKPSGHHLTSMLFHIVNALILFIILVRMTGALWRSAFVAVLFAVHPINVESVAWIAERKNVLSAFFWLLTIWAYVPFY